jgi:kynurenine formamidase
MTFQTNFIAMLDHVGTHVDAFRHVNPDGKAVDEMVAHEVTNDGSDRAHDRPLEKLMCRHIVLDQEA